ncbi:hypothetical protein CPC735_052560 [Coccidioides posadasii C735 delta SOWgp]|uniref:Uncharacterized protein n=1 Tax=Coccidioides posadasii (strain C735) TaxID=222929 RepID=C5PH83_COCP7|nr:hypothetical protein CPC735_052560 [Coccidioides posadasii C735 delta SOWgp]EER23886.1 hypothetical protein CPC735_052560 [Coccidioides posadasii C735 delta SOWgp]|eukprot:XP_003066031.1 hypothetical protein CPC735_052560 [Coccidioides posadasii C735 delta SOWgp]
MAETAPAPAPHAVDDEESILHELNEAIAANPELRAPTPKPAEGEWEDFDRLLAENPQLAAPVVASPKSKSFYKSKDKWECRHEGEEIQTDIERDPGDGTPEVLINEVRGICNKCMEKWVNLENALEPDATELGGSSHGPARPPTYDQAQGANVLDVEDDDLHPRPLFDIDDGPGKGKGRAGGHVRYGSDDEVDDDDRSMYSQEDGFKYPPPGLQQRHQGRSFADDDDDDDDNDDDVLYDMHPDCRPHEGSQGASVPNQAPPTFRSDDEDEFPPVNPRGSHAKPPNQRQA